MKKPVKICKNPDCGVEIVDYKSSKREYCSDYCRNHHGHKRRCEENFEFIAQKKGLANNYKILKRYIDAGVVREDFDKLLKFGFDPKYLPQKYIDRTFSPNIAFHIIKDIIFGLDPVTNQVIINSVNNEK
ncbi:hypothetical protein [Flavobacterium aciduliphilum]|uniref:Uncharacterized protein n=1 Tax=Flavobacterium aciduliphilum TaxID=1101402 RepID=A0A328YFN3_9FLAO|nr:hypothetical protein [Flavobacterium aciduliphilum]RAR71485.1 hypothetical protein CLV55_10741 [Flavobacterium aciduliphilum]